MSLTEKSCAEFTQLLASRAPTPGGGGAGAMAGALGIALCAMAGNLTVGKPKYAEAEEEIRQLLDQCESYRHKMLALVDADAAAFAPLAKAYAIPRDDPNRADVLEAATLGACEPPMELMRLSYDVMGLLVKMSVKCSTMMASDILCGMSCCRAALECGAWNVLTNTRTLRDRVRAKALESEVDQLYKKSVRLSDTVRDTMAGWLRGD